MSEVRRANLRPLQRDDESLLPHFLMLAAHEQDVEVVLNNSDLARYVEGWGRAGDCGVVVEAMEARTIVGIVWARFWTQDNHGFAWINERTPELAVAVEPEFRGQGIGRQLIELLKRRLLTTPIVGTDGEIIVPVQVALSVRADSPAVALYHRCGFVEVEGSRQTNRVGSVSFNMLARL